MTPLSPARLRGIVNLLSDPGSAANAAHILATEARARGILVADLVAQATAPAPSNPPPVTEPVPPTAPAWEDVEPIDDGGAYARRISASYIGLVVGVIAETPKAWLVETPRGQAWLAKSVCEFHGKDAEGRMILVLPNGWPSRPG